MLRAASLTTTAGGYAVPVELDTTLLITNAGRVNPIRQLADVRQTNVNTVEFINTTGITAGTARGDGGFGQRSGPRTADVNIEKAFAFVPFSIEIGSDWANFQNDMAMAFADAKDDLEADKFLTGLGHGSNEPQGLIAAGGATAVTRRHHGGCSARRICTRCEQALSERYQPNASIVGNRATYQKIRQLDTGGGANLWVQLQNDNPPTLSATAYEWTDYDNTPTTADEHRHRV
jgi:HK97 family phage major capsid protein